MTQRGCWLDHYRLIAILDCYRHRDGDSVDIRYRNSSGNSARLQRFNELLLIVAEMKTGFLTGGGGGGSGLSLLPQPIKKVTGNK